MSRMYSVEELRAAADAINALCNGINVLAEPGEDGELQIDYSDVDVCVAKYATRKAIGIIRTALTEIEAEHNRLNEKAS